jgi:hypothetical protein
MSAKILMNAKTLPAGQAKGVLILWAVIVVTLFVPPVINSTNSVKNIGFFQNIILDFI